MDKQCFFDFHVENDLPPPGYCKRFQSMSVNGLMIRSHRIRLNPTPEQELYFRQCADVARFSWNWALAEYNGALARQEKPSVMALRREFNRRRNEDGFAPWVRDVQSNAYGYAFRDLQTAISRYHKLRKEGKLKPPKGWRPRKDGKPFGWPRFKNRERTTPAFGLSNSGAMVFNGHWVRIRRCPGGLVNMAEPLRLQGRVLAGRATYVAGHWYLSVVVEMPAPAPVANDRAVGIDLGIKYRAVTSDGRFYENPKALARYSRKMRLLQRSLSRMERGGANYKKRRAEIARLHARIANIRRTQAHRITTEIVARYGIIGLENLNIQGMVKNRKLAKAISDAGMYQIRQQLEYKAQASGGRVVVISRWFASSKICSACGEQVEQMPLSVRHWACPNCGAEHERDGNAAVNIRNEALRLAGIA